MNGQTIGYARVSTIDQNIERQTEQLKHCDVVCTGQAAQDTFI